MEVSAYKRWCHACPRCAQAYLFARATGRVPADMGFEESLFTRDKQDCYYLFKGDSHPRDAWILYHKQSETLAFSMALQRGVQGPLVDHFRQTLGPAAQKTQRHLARAVFRVHGRPGKHPVEKAAHTLYKELVREFRREGCI